MLGAVESGAARAARKLGRFQLDSTDALGSHLSSPRECPRRSAGDRNPMSGEFSPAERLGDQVALDQDQTLADRDQSLSDGDQTSADIDQTASERDQRAADRDQRWSDRDHAQRPPGIVDADYALSREGRSRSAADRDLAASARAETARNRHSQASARDAVADWRDRVAAMRDEMAAEFDRQDAAAEGQTAVNGQLQGIDVLMNAARDRQRAATNRVQASRQRAAAAKDRAHAAEDRRQATLDRATAEAELVDHGTDHLTGTLRRHVGLDAMRREWDRAERSEQAFVVAFIDVDHLKATNDDHGHKAGDELLQAVARCVKEQLRPYDVIARYGGDEFVVSITGQDGTEASRRFDLIALRLAHTKPGAGITVGLAQRTPADSLVDLIGRADAAMRAQRQGR